MKISILLLVWFSVLSGQEKVALVIGNSTYERIESLDNPKEETDAISKELERLGFTVYKYNDLTNVEMLNKLVVFTEQLSKLEQPIALVYYSGHGAQVDNQAYLIPTNVDTRDPNTIRFQAISVKEILARLNTVKQYATILFLDACRDVPTGTRGVSKGLAQVQDMYAGTLVISSTKPGQTARDNKLFNQVVLEKLALPKPFLLIANEISNEVAQKTKNEQIPTVTSERVPPNLILGSEALRSSIKIGNLFYQNQKITKQYYWVDAKAYCEELQIGKYKNWRLPAQDELKKISHTPLHDWQTEAKWKKWFKKHQEQRKDGSFIQEEFIENMPKNDWFWIDKHNESIAYAFSFSRGIANSPIPRTYKANAMCVHEKPKIQKEKTFLESLGSFFKSIWQFLKFWE